MLTFCFIWFNVSRLFIPHTYTQNSLHFNSPFSLLALLPLYTHTHIQAKNDVIYLRSFDDVSFGSCFKTFHPSHIHTNSLHFNSPFSLLALLLLYTHTHTHTHTHPQPFVPSHVKYTQTKNNVIYLQFFNDTYLALTLLFHLILTGMSWQQSRKGT